ncbi:MAG: FtsX-like permease family protein, partial [bacterium]
SQVFEATGTVDDIRIYAHLHTVQDLLGRGKVINAIEIVGCGCKTDLIKLGRDIERILPGTKAITIRHIAQTQSNTINLMEKFSLIVLIVVLIIGGASIANYMSSNIYQRRREIGILLAIGATPNLILSIFLEKAILLSLVGGAFGYLVGTGLAIGIGPRIVKIIVAPQPILIIWSMAIAVVINVIFSLIPAKRAANLDPVRILQEV